MCSKTLDICGTNRKNFQCKA